jgi:hypothetical protein
MTVAEPVPNTRQTERRLRDISTQTYGNVEYGEFSRNRQPTL